MKIDLKTRFMLALVAANLALMTMFAVSLYEKVRERLHVSAEQHLASYLDKEWRHLQLHNGQIFVDRGVQSGSEMHLQILKDGVLAFDSLPKSAKGITGGLSPTWKGMTRDFHGHINGKRFEMTGFYDLSSNLLYLSELQMALFKRCLLWLLFLGPFSWFLAKLLLRPFRTLSNETLRLDAKTLSFRFPEPTIRDEYGTLVNSFNALLTRLESSFHQIRRFAGNVSHELRTPLTVIRGEAEWSLRRRREVPEYEESMKKIVNRADGVQRIVNRLLFLSDLERSQLGDGISEVRVNKKVAEIIQALEKMHAAQKREIEISCNEVSFNGPSDLFSSVTTNLLENAFKYSKTRVKVAFEEEAGGLRLRVEDDGPGIPPTEREHVFEPFFRVSSHDETEGGPESHGLGLSIVRACMEAVRGKIELGESKWGGLAVNVWFPQTV